MSTRNDQSFNLAHNPLVVTLNHLVKPGSHRLQVIVAHAFIELLINAFIEAKCKHGKAIASHNRDYTHSAKLVILHEVGLLTDQEFRRFDWLRKLRNRAAHESLFAITPSDLLPFKGSK
jgi:hypothetical protein